MIVAETLPGGSAVKTFSIKISVCIVLAVLTVSVLQFVVFHYLFPDNLLRGGVVVAVVVLLILWLSIILVRRLTRPLVDLTKGFSAVREGDYKLLPMGRRGGEFRAVVAAYNDTVRELADVHEKLRNMADRDVLTGAYNRRALSRALEVTEAEYDSGDLSSVACMFVLIDNFERINGERGHLVGDELLRRMVATLIRHAGDRAVFRYGGEEFTLILSDHDIPRSLTMAKALQSEVAACGDYSISIGIAVLPDHALASEVLIARAYAALYKAKVKSSSIAVFQH